MLPFRILEHDRDLMVMLHLFLYLQRMDLINDDTILIYDHDNVNMYYVQKAKNKNTIKINKNLFSRI